MDHYHSVAGPLNELQRLSLFVVVDIYGHDGHKPFVDVPCVFPGFSSSKRRLLGVTLLDQRGIALYENPSDIACTSNASTYLGGDNDKTQISEAPHAWSTSKYLE